MSKHTNYPWYVARAYQRAEQERARGLAPEEIQMEMVDWEETARDLAKQLAEAQAELDAVRYAAHMPDDYAYGLPSWINQELYGKLALLLDRDGRVIRRSEDVERMLMLEHDNAALRALLGKLWGNYVEHAYWCDLRNKLGKDCTCQMGELYQASKALWGDAALAPRPDAGKE
jgi:hypothetical protein